MRLPGNINNWFGKRLQVYKDPRQEEDNEDICSHFITILVSVDGLWVGDLGARESIWCIFLIYPGEIRFIQFPVVTMDKENAAEYCWILHPFCFSFCAAESLGEQVEQQPSTLSVQEGDSAIINCTYTGSAFSYFSWNKQEAGESPQLIIDILENVDRKQSQRLTVLLNKKTKQLSLHISATQPGDTAMYFCAVRAHCFPGTCSLFSNLVWRLEPHLHPVL